MADVILPKMGDAMEEGVIVQWLKSVGDKVGPDDPVVEIETDKSNVEVPAGASGYIQSISAEPGETVPVGKVIAIIGAEAPSGNGASAPSTAPAPTATAPTPTTDGNGTRGDAETTADKAPPANLSGEGTVDVNTAAVPPAPRSNGAAPAPANVKPVTPTPVPVAVKTAPGWKPYDSFVGAFPENLGGTASLIGEPIVLEGETATSGYVKASPLAKAMAAANNIDLARVSGTGPDGSVVKRDIEAALTGATTTAGSDVMTSNTIASEPVGKLPGYGMDAVPVTKGKTEPAVPAATEQKPAPSVSVTINEGDEVQEYNKMRQIIAKRLLESTTTMPHFYVTAEMDMEALLKLREQINTNAGESQPKVSVNDCLIKAVAVALTENPKINAIFSDNKRIVRKAVNVGFGVALEDGLIVPVVRNADQKSVRAIARETKPLIEKARSGKLAPADYTGGTFTISNMGVLPDIEHFSAIINPGEGAILAVASTRTVPAVVDGEIVPRKRAKMTLSADHRVVDGADGANFLISLKRIIENPLEMLA